MKEMNNKSNGLSDNTSVDSPTNNDQSISSQNFAEIIQRHQQIRDEQQHTLEMDMTQLQEYQQQFNIEDDDTPGRLLEKVSQQVHDSMCCGVHHSSNIKAKSSSTLNASFQQQAQNQIRINKHQQSQKISNSHINNESFDSKNNSQQMPDQISNGLNKEGIPLINGFNAKIKSFNCSNQNSARLGSVIAQINGINQLPQSSGVVGTSSNFQSFKKNAMKLPKVTMRTSLLNQLNNQKTTSLPISPRIFEQAKFGNSSNQKKHMNNSQLNENSVISGHNSDSNHQQINPFALPSIDRTQQSTNYIECSSQQQTQQNFNTNLVGQSIYQGTSIFENQVNQISLHQNRNSLIKEIHSKNSNIQTDISQDQYESQADFNNNFHVQNSTMYSQNQVNQQQFESSFLITEAKVETNFKTRFTLNNFRSKALQSPLQKYSQKQQPFNQFQQSQTNERVNSVGSQKNIEEQNFMNPPMNQNSQQTQVILTKIKRKSLNNSSFKIAPKDSQNQLNLSENNNKPQKLCSSCYKKSQPQKQFSFDIQNLENSNEKINLNSSCLSDGQLQDMNDQSQMTCLKLDSLCKASNQSQVRIPQAFFGQSQDNMINKKYLSLSKSPPQHDYNTIRDNKFFNQFQQNYNNQLFNMFEEADKVAINNLKKNDKTKQMRSPEPGISMKHDLMNYLEQNSDIRKQIKEEQEQQFLLHHPKKQSQIQKFHVKKQQLQQLFENNNSNSTQLNQDLQMIDQFNGNNNNSSQKMIQISMVSPQSQGIDKFKQINQSQEASIKNEKMRNYGRYYLKPNEFNRLIKNLKDKNMSSYSQRRFSNDRDGSERIEDCSSTFIQDLNISTHSNYKQNSQRNSSLQ